MFKSSIIYLLSSTLSKLVPFFLLPLLTSYMPPEEFAVIAIMQAFYSICLAMLGNIQANIPNSYILDSQAKFSEKITAMLCLLIIFFLGLESLLLVIQFFYGEFLGIDEKYYAIMPIVAVMGTINLMNLALVRVKEHPAEYAVWEVSQAVLNVLISLLLVMQYSLGWEGRVYGILIPITIYGLCSFNMLYKHGCISSIVKLDEVISVARLSIPMIPHAVGAVAIALSDTFMIAALLGKKSVGIYSIGYQFGMVIMILTDAFSKAWQPMFYRLSRAGKKHDIRTVQMFYLASLPIIGVAYSICASYIVPYIVDERYASAIDFIPVVVAAYVAMGVYQLYFPYLILYKRTRVLAVITPLAAIMNVILNYMFLPDYGAIAAAYTSLLSFVFIAIALFVYAKRMEHYHGNK